MDHDLKHKRQQGEGNDMAWSCTLTKRDWSTLRKNLACI